MILKKDNRTYEWARLHVPNTNYLPIPDNKLVKVFKGILDRWPNCPLCGGRYGFADRSPFPTPDKRISVDIVCLHSDHFRCTFNERWTRRHEISYVKRQATFMLKAANYIIRYDTKNFDNKVSITSRNGDIIKLPFRSIERWFVPTKQLTENITKLLMLI